MSRCNHQNKTILKIHIQISDELLTSHSSETLKLVCEGNKQSINKKNRRADTRTDPCPFLFTANNPLIAYGMPEDRIAMSSRVHGVTLNGPVISENLPKKDMEKLQFQYTGNKYPFKFSYTFQPTKQEPTILANGTSVTPALLDGTVLYGLYLRNFPRDQDIPPYDPAENMHLPDCPWPNN